MPNKKAMQGSKLGNRLRNDGAPQYRVLNRRVSVERLYDCFKMNWEIERDSTCMEIARCLFAKLLSLQSQLPQIVIKRLFGSSFVHSDVGAAVAHAWKTKLYTHMDEMGRRSIG